MVELKSVEIFSRDCDHANVTIPVSGEWTLEEFKEKMESKLRTEAYFIYFHQGVEIEFDDDTLLSELFGPDFINNQGVAQVDVFLPSAAQVNIKTERNCKILEDSGEILTLEPGSEESVYLKPVGGWFSSIFTEFPVKLRVVIDTPRSNTVLVRHYQIKTVDTIVEIKSDGDIYCDDILALAAKNGTVMEFNSKDNQTYSKTVKPHFLPRTFDISSTAASTKFWANEKVVQNALLCSQAAYEENLSKIENSFPAGSCESISLDGIPQTCVLAFCNGSSIMYIAFTGSHVLDDWLVNLNLKLSDFTLANSGSQEFSPKVHTGFHERAKEWINDQNEQIMKKIKEWKPKTIVTTGHSLGAATSSIAHILLVLMSQDEEMKNVEFQNMAFASPLFGNLDLKKAILSHPDLRLRNMYHFVNCDDIVPAVTIIEETYANLTYAVSIIANNSSWLLGYIPAKYNINENQKAELRAAIENVLAELEKRKKMIDKPLFENRGPDTYMPIGHFIFMKKQDSSQSLHVFDFEESIEKSEHQWIGQILIKSLENLGKVSVIPPKYDHILSEHGMEKNYFPQVTNCLTSGEYDNLMQWKSETDREIN